MYSAGSGWELAEISGLPYSATTKGLAKLREHNVVLTETEDRPEGGFRYRYWPSENVAVRQHFVEAVGRVEALNHTDTNFIEGLRA